ncbi:MAG: hypothetical protein AMK75_02550 [Planctomycetes bacterium SM23_65]|nr:MAG: hypothetical protein AMK75_02550 [Planctomycetes bacterium SM23_65]
MLKDVNIATLRILAKMIDEACKAEGRREELGKRPAEFAVRETVTLEVDGTVKVESACEDAIIAQKAKPWDLFAVTLTEANKVLAAAGKAGLDLEKLVKLAEEADPKLVKKAKGETADALKAIKDEVRGFRWGRVLVSGNVKKAA